MTYDRSSHKLTQIIPALGMGFIFGFLLQKGGVTHYDVLVGQLLFYDFTVVKIMLSAIVTGMIGIYLMKSFGLVELYPKYGSAGSTLMGGLIFGVGFGLLGYCPGTAIGAAAQGNIDALIGGIGGILIGARIYAALFAYLDKKVLHKGEFGDITFPELLKVNPWVIIIPLSIIIIALFFVFESIGV